METNQKIAKISIVATMFVVGFLCMGILFAKPPIANNMNVMVIQKAHTLTSFTAKYYSAKVYLNWTVRSDSDKNFFVIEKSNDCNSYKILAIKEAAISPEGQDLLYSVIDDKITSERIDYNLYNVSETSKELMGTINVICPLDNQSKPLVILNMNPLVLALR